MSADRLQPVRHPWMDEEEFDATSVVTLRTSIVVWDRRERKSFHLMKS
jgi:hypothetical protein